MPNTEGPVSQYMHMGPLQVLLPHLEEEHKVRTIPFRLNTTSGLLEVELTSTKGPAAGYVLFKDDNWQVMLLHLEDMIQNLAYLFSAPLWKATP